MLNRRERCIPEAPSMFGKENIRFTANEVADATMKAVDTIRWHQRVENIVELALAISSTTKGNIPQPKREQILEDIAAHLLSFDYIILRRTIMPDVSHTIRTHSGIPKGRKDKALAQWRAVIGQLDRVLG